MSYQPDPLISSFYELQQTKLAEVGRLLEQRQELGMAMADAMEQMRVFVLRGLNNSHPYPANSCVTASSCDHSGVLSGSSFTPVVLKFAVTFAWQSTHADRRFLGSSRRERSMTIGTR